MLFLGLTDMKKFDKFLEFLFRGKLGRGLLIGSVTLGAAALTGCFALDTLSCACESTGCDSCASCLSGCNESCDWCGMDCAKSGGCEDCALVGCMFGDGCEKDCGDCGYITCGGCNRGCFDCGGGCSGCGSDCISSCGNCTVDCTGQPSHPDTIITIHYGSFASDNSNKFAFRQEIESISVLGNVSEYFTIQGFYDSEYSKMYFDASGNIVDGVEITESITLYAKMEENNIGARVVFTFDDSLALSPIALVNGSPISEFRTAPQVEGKRFIGWRIKGQTKTFNFKTGQIFHMYDIGTTATSVVLEAVYE